MTIGTTARKTSSPTLRVILMEHLLNKVKKEIRSRDTGSIKGLFNRELRAEIASCMEALASFDTDTLTAVNNAYMNRGYSVVPSLTTFGFDEQCTRNHAVFYDLFTEYDLSGRNVPIALEALGCSSLSLISMKFSMLDIPRARANLKVIAHYLRLEDDKARQVNAKVTGHSVRHFPASVSKLLKEQPGLADALIGFAVDQVVPLRELDAEAFLAWQASEGKMIPAGVM